MITTAHVTDTNNRAIGLMQIEIADMAGDMPAVIIHKGQHYFRTYKTGTRMDTGVAVFEMATDADERLWADAGCKKIFED
jgi:hypothetical protein